MYVHFNMDTSDFVEQLRYSAIKSGGSPQLIDQIDGLHSLLDMEAELEDVNKAKGEAENDRDDLWGELDTLVRALASQDDICETVEDALTSARNALSRHGLQRIFPSRAAAINLIASRAT